MPKLANSVPRYCKHKASGQAVVTLNGRDFYLGLYGTKVSRQEYDRLVGEWIAAGRQLPSSVYDLAVVELIARYFQWAGEYYQRDGKSTRVTPGIKCALRYLKESYGNTPVAEFGPLKLQSLRQQMVVDGLARSYVNQHCGWIKHCFRWGAAQEVVPASVPEALSMVQGLRRGKTTAPERPTVQPVSDDVVQSTLPHLGNVVGDMVRLQRLTGMRPGEVCTLRPKDVDRSQDVWLYRPVSHKNIERGKPRMICIGPQGQEVLARYMLRPEEEYCFSPRQSEVRRQAEVHERRVTPLNQGNRPESNRKRKPGRRPGKHYTTQSYGRAIRRVCDKAGIPRWAPNQLRHSVGTQVRREYGLEHAQATLGHSNIETSQIYAEVNFQRAVEVARKLG